MLEIAAHVGALVRHGSHLDNTVLTHGILGIANALLDCVAVPPSMAHETETRAHHFAAEDASSESNSRAAATVASS